MSAQISTSATPEEQLVQISSERSEQEGRACFNCKVHVDYRAAQRFQARTAILREQQTIFSTLDRMDQESMECTTSIYNHIQAGLVDEDVLTLEYQRMTELFSRRRCQVDSIEFLFDEYRKAIKEQLNAFLDRKSCESGFSECPNARPQESFLTATEEVREAVVSHPVPSPVPEVALLPEPMSSKKFAERYYCGNAESSGSSDTDDY